VDGHRRRGGEVAVRASATSWQTIEDDWPVNGSEILGYVRCPDGDRETYDRLLADLLSTVGYEGATAEPEWRWLRCNPAPTGDYSWRLGVPDGPGRGNFRGVLVTTVLA
jgi:hypothetical protein